MNSIQDEYEFREEEDGGTPKARGDAKTSKKKDKEVKQEELTKVKEQLPAIHAAFPHTATFTPGESL